MKQEHQVNERFKDMMCKNKGMIKINISTEVHKRIKIYTRIILQTYQILNYGSNIYYITGFISVYT